MLYGESLMSGLEFVKDIIETRSTSRRSESTIKG
jgi:hypothetical protein